MKKYQQIACPSNSGKFRTSPLTAAPKGGSNLKFRLLNYADQYTAGGARILSGAAPSQVSHVSTEYRAISLMVIGTASVISFCKFIDPAVSLATSIWSSPKPRKMH